MDSEENAIEESGRLRRTMRDLVALSTLPAVWTGHGLDGIARSLADVLLHTLSLDLIYSQPPCIDMYRYLMANGMSDGELDWFMSQDMRRHSIMGTDYYVTNEHIIQPDGTSVGAGDVYGYYVIAKQYFDRYKMPVMHTETNRIDAHSVEWLLKQWVNLLRLREDGVPVIGFTWYALTDQMDWDSALTKPRGHVNTLGLFDLKRQPRAVAKEFKRIIDEYGDLPLSGSELPILTA